MCLRTAVAHFSSFYGRTPRFGRRWAAQRLALWVAGRRSGRTTRLAGGNDLSLGFCILGRFYCRRGLALALFSYNKGLPEHPLAFYPIWAKCFGLAGSPDRTSFAVFATLFGLADFRWSGPRKPRGLNELFGLPVGPRLGSC